MITRRVLSRHEGSIGVWSDRTWLIPSSPDCNPLTVYDVSIVNDKYWSYVIFPTEGRKPDEFWLGPYIDEYDIYGPAIGPYKSIDEIADSEQWQLHQVNLKMGAYD